MSLFTIAIVGRPNVGKSTLFNALSKKNLSIVEDTPGVTVDYKENLIKLFNSQVKIIDTGGIIHNIKLNKSTKNDLDILNSLISNNSLKIVKKSDLILFVTDAKEGLTLEDKEISILLRKIHKNIILVINKTDNNSSKLNIPELTTLGFKNIVEISAMHKKGLELLYTNIKNYFNAFLSLKESNITENNHEPIGLTPYLTLAIVGKPNTGKSTLINALLKEKRLIVSDIPGTTKDSISTYFKYQNKYIRVVDTAGLIKKSRIKLGIDTLAKNETIRSIIFAQVVILVIDAANGLTKQDLSLASYIIKEGRALIIAINKIDLIKNPKQLKNNIENMLNNCFSEIKGINIILISGLKAINIDKLFIESIKVYKKWTTVIKTSLLNKWLSQTLSINAPPLHNGKALKIKFMSQEKTRPPTFNLWINLQTGIPKQYLSYLRNQLYKTFELWSTPIRFNIKNNKNPYIK